MAMGILQKKQLAVVDSDPAGSRWKVARLNKKGQRAKEASHDLLRIGRGGLECTLRRGGDRSAPAMPRTYDGRRDDAAAAARGHATVRRRLACLRPTARCPAVVPDGVAQGWVS